VRVTIRFTPNEVAFLDRIAKTLNCSRSYATRALIGSWAIVSQTPLGVMLSPEIKKALEERPDQALKSPQPLIEQLKPMDEIAEEAFDGHTGETAVPVRGKSGKHGRKRL
jgi:hypothetical protein